MFAESSSTSTYINKYTTTRDLFDDWGFIQTPDELRKLKIIGSSFIEKIKSLNSQSPKDFQDNLDRIAHDEKNLKQHERPSVKMGRNNLAGMIFNQAKSNSKYTPLASGYKSCDEALKEIELEQEQRKRDLERESLYSNLQKIKTNSPEAYKGIKKTS